MFSRAFLLLAFLFLSACNPSPEQPGTNDPRFIQVTNASTGQGGQEKIPTSTVQAFVAPSNENPALTVLETASFFDHNGTLHVIGIVRNHGQRSLASIQVTIQVMDSQRVILTQATVPISTDPLLPDEEAVFIQEFQQISNTAPLITAEIAAFKIATSGRVDLTINHVIVSPTADSLFYLTGEILNAQPVPVHIENVSAAFFDQDGYIRVANTWELGSHYLEPGESGPFRIPIDTSISQVHPSDAYEIYYRAVKGPPVSPLGLSFQGMPEFFVDSQDIFHLVAYVRNDSDVSLVPYLLASIYDPQGRLIDTSQAVTFGLPLSPGETQPVDFTGWGVMNTARTDLDGNWRYALQWDPILTHSTLSNWTTLEIQLDSQSNQDRTINIQGVLTNPADWPVSGYTILARFWDPSDGSTLAMIAQTGADTLLPSHSVPFNLEFQLPKEAGDPNPEVEWIAKGQQEE